MRLASIAVISAGIGGLTAAVALRQAGFDVDVYEQAQELTEVGGGINMGPNAARILYRLGLGDALDREAVHPTSRDVARQQDSLPSP
jgi:salicylate hydroxylase